jgi:tetratricopeptide (TPR) repeat protein
MSNLGYLYLKSGDVKAARHWFDRALELFPLQQQAASRLAMLEMATGHPEQALSRCERLVESYPQNYACLQVLAVSSRMQNDLAAALQGFAKVLEAFPDDRYARLGKAEVMLAQSQQAEAFGLVDQVLAETNNIIANGDFEAYDYWIMAGCHALLGDGAAAYEWLDKAAEAGRRFSLWDQSDPIFAGLRENRRFDNYIAETRVDQASD